MLCIQRNAGGVDVVPGCFGTPLPVFQTCVFACMQTTHNHAPAPQPGMHVYMHIPYETMITAQKQ